MDIWIFNLLIFYIGSWLFHLKALFQALPVILNHDMTYYRRDLITPVSIFHIRVFADFQDFSHSTEANKIRINISERQTISILQRTTEGMKRETRSLAIFGAVPIIPSISLPSFESSLSIKEIVTEGSNSSIFYISWMKFYNWFKLCIKIKYSFIQNKITLKISKRRRRLLGSNLFDSVHKNMNLYKNP